MINPFGQTRVEDKEYEFETENPFLTHENPFEEGLQLADNGNLSDAVLAFEAAAQKNPENVEAWYRLGAVQQENEKEIAAISALREAVKLNPKHIGASLVFLPPSLSLSPSFFSFLNLMGVFRLWQLAIPTKVPKTKLWILLKTGSEQSTAMFNFPISGFISFFLSACFGPLNPSDSKTHKRGQSNLKPTHM